MGKYKLTYFNVKGFGEPIRYMLAYQGVDWDDHRIQRDQWSPELKKATPFGKVPTLEIPDGRTLYDSVAICRWLAAKSGLGGANPEEELQIDQIIGAIKDFSEELRKIIRAENDEAKQKFTAAFLNEALPFYLERIERILKENSGYLANGKLSWADLYFIAWSETADGLLKLDLEAKYPCFRVLKERVQSHPGIKAYIQNRPATLF